MVIPALIALVVLCVVNAPLLGFDLWRQPTRVGAQWLVPSVLLLMGGLLVAVFAGVDNNFSFFWGDSMVTFLLALFASLSMLWISHGVALGVSRGWAPGGTAPRRPFLGFGVLAACGIALAFGRLGVVALGLPVVLWSFHRDGGARLERGARAAAGFIVAGFVGLFLNALFTSLLVRAGPSWAFLVGWMVLAGLAAGWTLVYLKPHPLVYASLPLQFFMAGSAWWIQQTTLPLPVGFGAPLAEDWTGRPATHHFVTDLDCIRLVPNGVDVGSCSHGPRAVALSTVASTLDYLDAKTAAGVERLALGRGDARILSPDPSELPARGLDVVATEQGVLHGGVPVSFETLRSHPIDEPLWVEASPKIPLHLFVSMCTTATPYGCGVAKRR